MWPKKQHITSKRKNKANALSPIYPYLCLRNGAFEIEKSSGLQTSCTDNS